MRRRPTLALGGFLFLSALGAGVYSWPLDAAPRAPSALPAPLEEAPPSDPEAVPAEVAAPVRSKEVDDPNVVGSWRHTQALGDTNATTIVTLRPDASFEHVIELPEARVVRSGTYAARNGMLYFKLGNCTASGHTALPEPCKNPPEDSSYVLSKNELSIVGHGKDGDSPSLKLTRVTTP